MRGGRCSPAFHRICAGCALLPAALFVGTPTPPAPSAKDTRTLLPAPPPYPRLRQRIPVPFCRHPHPRLRRSSPAPTGGRGPCVAISGEQPCPALLQDLPMLWTVGISPRGERLTGRGNLFPLPCLPHSNHLTSRRQPPPHPRLRRSAPAPRRGQGQCLRYQGSSRIRGGAGGQPCQVLRRFIPGYWTVGISPPGEGLTGRGNSFPLPCLSRSRYLASAGNPHPARAFGKGYPCTSAGNPHPHSG